MTPRLFVGSCPRSRDDIDQLKREAGITVVVDLQTEGDFAYREIDWPLLGVRRVSLSQESIRPSNRHLRSIPCLPAS